MAGYPNDPNQLGTWPSNHVPGTFTFATLPVIANLKTGIDAYTTDRGLCIWNGIGWVPVNNAITPQQFGAVADSVNDDTAAVRAADAAGFAAKAQVTFNKGTYVMSGATTLSAPLSFDAGATLYLKAGATVVVNGTVYGSQSIIFAGPGTLSGGVTGFFGGEQIYAEWWGAVGDMVTATGVGTDNAPLIQLALNARSTGVAVRCSVRIFGGVFKLASGITIPDGLDFQGDGKYSTFINVHTNFTGDVVRTNLVGGYGPLTTIRDMAITCILAGAPAQGLRLANNITSTYLENLYIGGFNSQSFALSGIACTGVAGQFSCTAAPYGLAVGQQVVISGAWGGTTPPVGYANPTTYSISTTNGSTAFTLQSLQYSPIVTTQGTPTGITVTVQADGGLITDGTDVFVRNCLVESCNNNWYHKGAALNAENTQLYGASNISLYINNSSMGQAVYSTFTGVRCGNSGNYGILINNAHNIKLMGCGNYEESNAALCSVAALAIKGASDKIDVVGFEGYMDATGGAFATSGIGVIIGDASKNVTFTGGLSSQWQEGMQISTSGENIQINGGQYGKNAVAGIEFNSWTGSSLQINGTQCMANGTASNGYGIIGVAHTANQALQIVGNMAGQVSGQGLQSIGIQVDCTQQSANVLIDNNTTPFNTGAPYTITGSSSSAINFRSSFPFYLGNTGATPAPNLYFGTVQRWTQNSSVTWAAPANPAGYGTILTLLVQHDATAGNYTTAWNAAFRNAPAIAASAAANSKATFQFMYDGTNWQFIGGSTAFA
jgi:hypothetical protein